MPSYTMLIDLDICSGCHACSVACKAEHRAPTGSFRHRVQTAQSGSFPLVTRQFIPTLCQHCTDAPCIPACPTEAIQRTESGAVLIDPEMCVGTGSCVEACPYGAIYYDLDTSQAVKCDFCQDRLAEGEQPACAATCPTDAILFGFSDEPVLAEALKGGKYAQWEPKATGPSVWYKGLTADSLNQLTRINDPKERTK